MFKKPHDFCLFSLLALWSVCLSAQVGPCTLALDCPEIGTTRVEAGNAFCGADWPCDQGEFSDDDACWTLRITYDATVQKQPVSIRGGFKTHQKCLGESMAPAQRWFSMVAEPIENLRVARLEVTEKDYFGFKNDGYCENEEPGISELWAKCDLLPTDKEMTEEDLAKLFPWPTVDKSQPAVNEIKGQTDPVTDNGLSADSPEYRAIERALSLYCDWETDFGELVPYINDKAAEMGFPCVSRAGLANKVGSGFAKARYGYVAKGCALAIESANRANTTDLVGDYSAKLHEYMREAGISSFEDALQWECPNSWRKYCDGREGEYIEE